MGALDRSLLCVAGGCVHAIFLFNWLCLVYFVLLFFAPATIQLIARLILVHASALGGGNLPRCLAAL